MFKCYRLYVYSDGFVSIFFSLFRVEYDHSWHKKKLQFVLNEKKMKEIRVGFRAVFTACDFVRCFTNTCIRKSKVR